MVKDQYETRDYKRKEEMGGGWLLQSQRHFFDTADLFNRPTVPVPTTINYVTMSLCHFVTMSIDSNQIRIDSNRQLSEVRN